jgi:hypothetical protein
MMELFLKDTHPGLQRFDYPLTVRFKDGNEERIQVFTLRFDKNAFTFLRDTTADD